MAKTPLPETLTLVDLHSQLDKVREKAKNEAFVEVEMWIDAAWKQGYPMDEKVAQGYELAMGEIKHYIKQKLNPNYGE